jgi:hypothetical protein
VATPSSFIPDETPKTPKSFVADTPEQPVAKPALTGPQLLTAEPAAPPVEPRRTIGGVVSTTPYRDPLRQITTPARPGEQRIGRMPDEDVIDRVGRMLTEFWYGGVGSGETLLSRATTPAPADPNLAAVDKNRIPLGQTPLVRPEVFAGDTRGPHRAILEAAGGLTTLENAVLLGGTAAARAIPGAAQAFSGGFATQMLTEALHEDPEWAEAKETGDDAVMAEIATRKGVQLLFGLAAGAHAVQGKTAGVRGNRTTEPAARASETGAISETPTFPVEQTGRGMVRATAGDAVAEDLSKRNVLQLKVIARKEGLDPTQFHGKGAKANLIQAITEKREGTKPASKATVQDYLSEPVKYGGETVSRGEMIADLQSKGTPEQVSMYLGGRERTAAQAPVSAKADLARGKQSVPAEAPQAPVKPAGLLESLDAGGKEASERLRARGVASGASVSMNEFLNPKTIRDMAQAITGDIARGGLKLEDLGTRLAKEYGPKARLMAQKVWNEAQNILKPLGADEFSDHGPVFRGYWRDESGATKKLRDVRAGEAPGALYDHRRQHAIDLVWHFAGEGPPEWRSGAGLAHVEAKHPEMLGKIQQTIDAANASGKVFEERGRRYYLAPDGHMVAVDPRYGKDRKRWVVTAVDEYKGRSPAAEGSVSVSDAPSGAAGTASPAPGEPRPSAAEGGLTPRIPREGATGTTPPVPEGLPPLIARREAAVKRFDSLVEHGSQLVEEGQPFSAWKRAMQREFPDASSGELMRAWPRAKKRYGERGSFSEKPAFTAPSAEEVAGAKSRLKFRAKEFLESEKGEQSFEFSTQDFADLTTVGRDLLSRGTHRLAEWQRQMLDTFGEWVREHLDDVWAAIQKPTRSAFVRKGGNEPGFLICRTGELIDLEEGARHYNMVRDLEGELRRGAIRGRGNGIEYRGEVDPANLRAAVKRVADRYPEVYVDSPRGSFIYDSADLVRHRHSVALTKPARRVGHEAERGSLSLRPAKPVSVVEQGAEYAAKPSAFRVAIDFLRSVESRIASEGQAGKKLSKVLGKAQDAGEVAAGKRIVALRDAGLLELSKQDQANLLDVLEGRADPASEAVKKAFAGIRAITDDLAMEAETSKIIVTERRTIGPKEDWPQGFRPTRGQQERHDAGEKVPIVYKRPFRRRADFFPHVIPSTEALKSGAIRKDVIENLVRQGIRPDAESAAAFVESYRSFIDKGGRSEMLEKYLVDSGQAKSRSQAFWLLTRFRKRHIRRQGSLEYARQVDLPFYDPNPARVLPPWAHSASMRLAQVREFGQGNELVNHLVREIEKAGGDSAKVRLMVDRVLKMVEEPDTDGAKLSRTLRALQGFKLGLSAIPNVAQGALNSLLASDLPSTLAGAKGLLSKEGRRFAMQSGASLEGVINEMVQYAGGENQALSKFLKGVGFTATEQANRIFAANAGITYARRMLSRLKANPENGRARKVLEELGLDADALLKKGAIEGNDALQAAKKFSDLTQFRADPKDLPLFASSNAGKVFFQFKQYIYGQTRLLHREVVEEFAAGRFGRGARALVVLGIVFPMAGEVIQDLRSLITGRKRPTKALERYLDDIVVTGALGVLQDMIESGSYGRATETIVGPTMGEIGETINNAVKDAISGKPLSEPRKSALLKQAFRRIPLLGPIMVNRIFGSQKKQSAVREPRRTTKSKRRVVY